LTTDQTSRTPQINTELEQLTRKGLKMAEEESNYLSRDDQLEDMVIQIRDKTREQSHQK
jgi:hypothetical protein